MSRVGYTTAAKANLPVHWLDATILRVGAGLAFTILAFGLTSMVFKSWRDGPGRWKKALPWLALNAVLGPSLGMACFQFALVTTKAHVVHAIVATLPIAVMLIAWASGEERPDSKGVWGTILAVLGVILLVVALH
jgi:drug/metabolite transporter (DMT)-like permease